MSPKKRTSSLVAAAIIAAAAPHARSSATTFPNDEKTIVHVLNRMGFGARAADIDRVKTIGIQRYLDEQLHPERIPDTTLSARLVHLKSVGLSPAEISRQFEQPLLESRRERRQLTTDAGTAAAQSPSIAPPQQRANTVVVELAEQKILRAIHSDRQLQEVLADFWFNHFNVDARKGRVRFLLTEYERDAIRPHVLGTFRDLLGATAHSPAMLFYLDNWLNADPNGPHPSGGTGANRPPRRPLPRSGRRRVPLPDVSSSAGQVAANLGRRRGLNENYARELMELHTLGVDGGYTQQDVTEVARAFTGWTIGSPREGGGFRFEPRLHDQGEKSVLGHRIKANGGQEDGERVLDILATHPATARFISAKLARRFVSDAPPAPLVDRMASRFTTTSGNIREVVATLLTSPEFLAAETYRAKVKTPLEFIVSAVRATGSGGSAADARSLVRSLQDLGMPLYQCQPPTGYKDTADGWTNTGALLNRMNFALALASGNLSADRPARFAQRGQVPGGQFMASPDVASWPDLIDLALAHDVSETTRATIARAAAPRDRVALALGSPEFQRR